jgi:hypothetical protein
MSARSLAPLFSPRSDAGGVELLIGARGRAALDVEAAARALAALSSGAAAHPECSEIEINPLLVTPTGVVALDARLVRATQPTPEEVTVHA